ncbi:hypothetical protein SAMN05660841_02641 [Sphingobacterium nematocida]|uniref:Uncharacterized protein n=1 Tax=Sphingobacterium nematocida TaxID=1513896 RepID=A0A1T5EKR2_9SPHI|nr:hypothetical protein [Sphingobacterium nematocida]SKB84260.1 hypothetical protein SAMN05660841_02641 [Sphingobacterium nematocida]
MDAKQLFRFFHSKYELTNWLNENGVLAQSDGDVKWFYCGINDDFKVELVDQTIQNFFSEDEIYLCISSSKSSMVSKSNVTAEIAKNLHKKEIGLMDSSFTKMMFFNSYGTFKSGVIREFPETSSRPNGHLLNVAFFANIMDENTSKVAKAINKHFDHFEKALHKDYGGVMEYLWIDLELVESHKPFPFRFQKRVSNRSSYTEMYSYNVGHYSIHPDYEKLKGLSTDEEICAYVFDLLYQSTQILADKQKKLGDFDATKFRLDFLAAKTAIDSL